MSNNIEFISSISNETDFENLVRKVAAYIYGAEAYLIGGPYDGGRDLVYKRLGKEVREAVQITIQEKSLETKVLEDAKKIRKLVDEHSYPERFTLFFSHTLSASKKIKIKKSVRDTFGIELEIYDATELEQIITEDSPDILQYLLTEIHKYKPSLSNTIDRKARAFYDYLALGKDAADLKDSIVVSQILSSLFDTPKDDQALINEIEMSGVRRGVIAARIGSLLASGKLRNDGGILSLESKEAARIENIFRKDETGRIDLLNRLKEVTCKIAGVDLSSEALDLIREVYRVSFDIQISETSFEPPRLTIVKELIHRLEYLLVSRGGVTEDVAKNAAKTLIELGAQNEYLSNQCASLLCVNLLGQKRLDKYIRERKFFIYLDATVYIRYLALFNFKGKAYLDKEMRATEQLRDAIRGLKNCDLFVTREHLEETIRHITQAEKISRFANDALVERFGESKNVYFNLYLNEKRQRKNYTFSQFLEDLIGYERDTHFSLSDFEAYLACAQRFNKLANIITAEYQGISLEADHTARKISYEYEQATERIGKFRKHRTAFNDVIACYLFSDDKRHVDEQGYGHVPMFITWDSTQHLLRQVYRSEFPFSEWLIYSPYRAIERLSMISFNVSGKIIKDNVLAILDEDYIRDSSLIDTLAALFGESKVESDSIISVLSKVSGRLHNEAGDAAHFESNERSLISEALLTIQNTFRDRFGEIRKLFSSQSDEEAIVDILTRYSGEKISKDQLAQEFTTLLQLSSQVAGPQEEH